MSPTSNRLPSDGCQLTLTSWRKAFIEDGEQRWQTLGQVGGVTVLLVAHTIAEEGPTDAPVEVIHIISARRATRKERMRYEQG